MNKRIEMLKEMVEKSANPVGWIGYQEGHLVSFLKTQEQVNSFLTATDPTGRVEPVYTHPVKEPTDEEWNKAFDCYCETEEGVLKFDFELRDEWKKEQLIRWKEALRKAQEK